MLYRLSAVRSRIDNQPIAVLQLLLSSNLSGKGQETTEQRGVLGQCVSVRRNVLLWDDEYVYRSLGVDVGERKRVSIFSQAFYRDGAVGDLAEEADGDIRHQTVDSNLNCRKITVYCLLSTV